MRYLAFRTYREAAQFAASQGWGIGEWRHLHSDNMYIILGAEEPEIYIIRDVEFSREQVETIAARNPRLTRVEVGPL